jgi:hypothetical protein
MIVADQDVMCLVILTHKHGRAWQQKDGKLLIDAVGDLDPKLLLSCHLGLKQCHSACMT